MELEERNKHIQQIADEIQRREVKTFMRSLLLITAARAAVGVCLELDVHDMSADVKCDYLAILTGARDRLVAPEGAKGSVWPIF